MSMKAAEARRAASDPAPEQPKRRRGRTLLLYGLVLPIACMVLAYVLGQGLHALAEDVGAGSVWRRAANRLLAGLRLMFLLIDDALPMWFIAVLGWVVLPDVRRLIRRRRAS